MTSLVPPRSSRRALALPTLFAAVLLAAAACGSSAGSEDATSAADQVTTSTTEAAVDTPEQADGDEAGETDEDALDSAARLPFFDKLDVDGDLDRVFTVEVERCVTAKLLDDPELAAAAEAAESDDIEAMAVVAGVVFDCTEPGVLGDELAAAFAEGIDLGASPELGRCFEEELRSEDGNTTLVGLMLLGSDQPVPAEYQAGLVEMFTRCIPADLIAGAMAADATDGLPAEAIDEACLVSALNDQVMEDFWTAMVADPEADFEDLDPEVQLAFFEPIIGCISMSAVLSAEMSSSGVELSDSTLACIDDEFASMDLASLFLDEDGDAKAGQALGIVLLGCMTPEELQEMNS